MSKLEELISKTVETLRSIDEGSLADSLLLEYQNLIEVLEEDFENEYADGYQCGYSTGYSDGVDSCIDYPTE